MTVLIKNYSAEQFVKQYGLLEKKRRILNAGSGSARFGENCVNIDIKDLPGVDLVCDIHALPSDIGRFDAIICNAVLQYCKDPRQVAESFWGALEPGGLLFVDAPWVQPFCENSPDRYRFSRVALLDLFERFELIDSGASIRPGSAFAMLGHHIAKSLTPYRTLNYILGKAAATILQPLGWIKTHSDDMTAGAFYIVCRKAD